MHTISYEISLQTNDPNQDFQQGTGRAGLAMKLTSVVQKFQDQ